ncbi:aminoimidazole riboside kinase [soil metagenome]
MTKSILAIGEILIDLIVNDGASSLETATNFVARSGGAPANVAVAAARQGVPSGFCGVCGDDPFGRRLRALLQEYGVDDATLRSDAVEKTSLALVWKDARGDGHFQLVRIADRYLNDADVEAADIPSRAAIVVGSVVLSEQPSRRAIHRATEIAFAAGVPVCLDLNIRPSLWPKLDALTEALAPLWSRTSLLKLSLDDARALHGDAISPEAIFAWAHELDIPHVVLTDGSRGCWFRGSDGGPEYLAAFSIVAVEPTGAGDAFTAGILGGLIANGWSGITKSIAEFASAAGAITATRSGAIESLPTRDEIEQFLAERRVPTVSA